MDVPENKTHNPKQYSLRAKMPLYFRMAAAGALLVAIVVVGIGFYRERSKASFKLKSEHTQLSTDVVSEINGYERLETDNGVTKYFIKADHAKTFSDNHLELDNVYLEVYGIGNNTPDRMMAEAALYIPGEDKNFTAYLKGNVNIETSDALKIKTNHIVYTKETETADIDEAVEFERDNVRGRSFGATVRMGEKYLDLLKDVEIETFETADLAKSNIRYAKIKSDTASFDQISNNINLNTNVAINILAKNKTTDIYSDRAFVKLAGGESETKQLKKIELFDNVRITSTDAGGLPTNLASGYAFFDKDADRFELKNGVHIVLNANGKASNIRANEAVYEQTAGNISLTGGAEIIQGGDELRGDVLHATLFPGQKIKDAVIRGNASVRQITPERTMNITAPELNAKFAEAGHLKDANAVGSSSVEIVPVENTEYTRVTTTAQRGIGLIFRGEGLLEQMRTDGRTTILLNAPNGQPDAANKRVTADTVKTEFSPNGKDILRAEAVGDAELYVEPLTTDQKNYQTTINAPRFDCEFFPTGNNAKVCVAGKKAKAVRAPSVASKGKGSQTMTAEILTAQFSPKSNDIESLAATGNAKFTELDRSGIAQQITYTQSDGLIRLRGSDPTVWDSRGRAKAGEIDLDTRNDRSSLRGGVSTTYYSQKQIKSSTPFAANDKPVFLTAESAEFDHSAETAIYTGNARGWQDNNYVRGNRLLIDQAGGKFLADGNVQSLIYNAKLKRKGRDSNVPTSASAGSMVYDRESRVLSYKTGVDIRQGTDRITAGSADVYLDENNDVSRTVAETNVTITQPTRRASGDWVQYSADDEVAILRGNPATVTDPENGSSQSGQLTFSMRENRITTESSTKQNTTGRTRTVYKIKDLKP